MNDKGIFNNRVVIFDYSVYGHHLEYLNHIYNKAIYHPDTEFYFVLPIQFTAVKEKMIWPSTKNISFHFENFDQINESYGIIKSYRLNRLLHHQVKKHNATHLFLISLISFLPFLPLVINKRIKVSGIIYQIFLYRWKESDLFRKSQDALIYFLLSKLSVFDRIFILNDSGAANYLNRKFKTKKFEFLPDPFVPISTSKTKNIRKELNIESNKKVLLHFGGLSERKGTLEILNTIHLLNDNELVDLCFIFAGKVYEDIKIEFYRKLNIEKQRVQIVIFDEFCEFSFLGSLCTISDFILIPYKATSQSSGILGYAAQFHKPVVAPKEKLLGKLVKKYQLGYRIRNIDSFTIANFIKNLPTADYPIKMNYYLRINNISNFTKTIFNYLNG